MLQLDILGLNWNTAIIVFMKIFRMHRRRYKSRHLIIMFIGTPYILMYKYNKDIVLDLCKY